MKKILIVSQNSLSLHANNGKTLTNIFQKWESNSLAQLYFQDEIPESVKFHKFYRIRDIDLLNKLFNPSKNCISSPIALDWVSDHYKERTFLFLKFVKIIKKIGFLKNIFREFLYKIKFIYMNDLKKQVSYFNPEAIFLVMSDYKFTIDIALKLSKDLNVPLYIYVLDDRYMMIKSSLFISCFKKGYLKSFESAVNKSLNCFCIGELMADVYTGEFNKKFQVLPNPINFNEVQFANRVYQNNKTFYRVLYAGGLTLGRFDALLDFAKVVKSTEKELDISIDFLVCSGDSLSNDQLLKIENLSINFLGRLNHSELNELYETVDFVTHLESNKSEFMKLTYLSISTKIPECLAKGICLIGYGPSQLSSMKLIYENELGCYIDNNSNFESQCEHMIKLIKSSKLCNEFVANGQQYSLKNFSHDVVSEKIISIINQVKI